MPWPAHPVSLLPFFLSWTNSDDGTDNFVARNEREFGSKRTSISQSFKSAQDARWSQRMQEYLRLVNEQSVQ
jgi:hypothetical protein